MANITNVNPSDILFTQDSISEEFGWDGGETLEETFREILYGEVDVDDISPLTVVKISGEYWVKSGNRRLYVYQKLNQLGRLDTVAVNKTKVNVNKVG